MATFTKEQLDAIRAKKEEDRTDEEKEALRAAERKTDPPEDGIDWEKVFQHPRFKELNKRAKDAEAEATRLQKEKEDADAENLKKQGEYKTLYEQEKAKREAAEAKVGQIESYEGTLKDLLDAELKLLPEASRKLVPDEMTTQQKLNYIARNRSVLSKPPAPGDLGARKRGGASQSEPVTLSEGEKETARRFGMSEAEYVKYRDTEGTEEGEDEE